MSGETLNKMYIALVGEFSRFTREQYAKRIEALGGIICEPKNDIDYIFYGKLPIEQIHEYKYGLETVFGAYNEIALLDKLTEVEMDKQDRLPLSRIEYYQTLPTQPTGCTVFMYEVRRMAQELADLRNKIEAGKLIDSTKLTPANTESSAPAGATQRQINEIVEWDLGIFEPGMSPPYSKEQLNEDLENEIRSLYETLNGQDYYGPIKEISVKSVGDAVSIVFHNDFNNPLGFYLKNVADKHDKYAIPVTETSDELQAFIRKELEKKVVKVSLPALGAEVNLKTPEVPFPKNEGIKETFTNGANTIGEYNDLLRDALRWRGLMASPAIRFFGSSGLKGERKVSGYAHFGAEFWTIHSGRLYSSEESVKNRELLTEYADILVENIARKADQWVMLNIEPDITADQIGEIYFEGEELRMEIPAREIIPQTGDLSDQVILLQNAQLAATERGIWQTVTLHIAGKKPKE